MQRKLATPHPEALGHDQMTLPNVFSMLEKVLTEIDHFSTCGHAIQHPRLRCQPSFFRVVCTGCDLGFDARDQFVPNAIRAGSFCPTIAGEPFEHGVRQDIGLHKKSNPVMHYRLVSNRPGEIDPSPGVVVIPKTSVRKSSRTRPGKVGDHLFSAVPVSPGFYA